MELTKMEGSYLYYTSYRIKKLDEKKTESFLFSLFFLLLKWLDVRNEE